jgi:transposase
MIVGIDISKNSFDASWMEANKEVHKKYDYTESGLNLFLDDTPEDGEFLMEATGVYHTSLALKLYESKRQVSICNPLVLKRYSQMKLIRAKTDKADARLIRKFGEENELSVWSPSSEEINELKQAHGWLNDQIHERTRLLNRQEAHNHQARKSAFVDQQMKRKLKNLNQQIKGCEKHLEVVVKKYFADLYSRLMTIPSIGPKTALELIIITGGFSRFEEIKSLSAYVGISPTNYDSGTSVKGKGCCAKMGNGRMRQLLYLCSWTAKKCNPSCKELSIRLTEKGKPKKVINIAIAHKLLRQAFAVAINNVEFSESYA